MLGLLVHRHSLRSEAPGASQEWTQGNDLEGQRVQLAVHRVWGGPGIESSARARGRACHSPLPAFSWRASWGSAHRASWTPRRGARPTNGHEHLLCAERFCVSALVALTIVGDATAVPILEMKKLRLREHSCLPTDSWLRGASPRPCSQVCGSPQSCFPTEEGRGTPRDPLHLSVSSRLPRPETGTSRQEPPASLLPTASTPWRAPDPSTNVTCNCKRVSPPLAGTQRLGDG